MRWLRQQRKVDDLSARASARAFRAARLRGAMGCWLKSTLQQPASLTWAFASGILVGTRADAKNARRARALLKWVNFTGMVWGFLEQKVRRVPKVQAEPADSS